MAVLDQQAGLAEPADVLLAPQDKSGFAAVGVDLPGAGRGETGDLVDAQYLRHEFAPGSRPLLAVSANGKQLLLLGGRYKFDERGIVDRDAQGRPILDPKHRQFINPRGGKFDRCVKKVKAQGSAVNAYAVCTAAGVKRNPKKPKVRDPEHKALLSDLAAHFAKDEAAGASRAMRGYLVQRTTDGMFAISKDGFHIATAKTPAHAEEIIGYLA